jgi:hypothetical protein
VQELTMTAQRVVLSIAVAVALTLAVQAQVKDRAEVALQAAIKQELVNGDLAGAIKQYEAIVSTYGKTNRPVAAQSLLRMAEAYEKLGNAQARNVYERIIAQFGDQVGVVSTARARLGRVESGQSEIAGTPGSGPRMVCKNCGNGIFDGSISQDGRWLATTDYSSGDIQVRDLSTGKVTRVNAKSGDGTLAGSSPAEDSAMPGVDDRLAAAIGAGARHPMPGPE